MAAKPFEKSQGCLGKLSRIYGGPFALGCLAPQSWSRRVWMSFVPLQCWLAGERNVDHQSRPLLIGLGGTPPWKTGAAVTGDEKTHLAISF